MNSMTPTNTNCFFIFYRFSILISGIFKFIKIKFNKKSFFKYSNNLESINYHEYKITSQNNEDGIIDFIINKICSKEINFIEIGFDFYENNSLNLFKTPVCQPSPPNSLIIPIFIPFTSCSLAALTTSGTG